MMKFMVIQNSTYPSLSSPLRCTWVVTFSESADVGRSTKVFYSRYIGDGINRVMGQLFKDYGFRVFTRISFGEKFSLIGEGGGGHGHVHPVSTPCPPPSYIGNPTHENTFSSYIGKDGVYLV